MTAKYITSTLDALPPTLEDVYNRMLERINPLYRDLALTALRWLVYAERPLSQEELAEACIVSHRQNPYLDDENRIPPGSIVRMLSSLVAVERLGKSSEHFPKKNGIS
jgi:hypothetical protein